jgi:transcriptional regulator with XRE-family HTH domain
MTQAIHRTARPQTGDDAGAIKDYAPAPSGTRALSIQVDELRTRTDMTVNDVHDLQDEVRAIDLHARARSKSKQDVPSLLEELARHRGMSWTDIAEVTSVSVSAVRKWRKGGDASAESRQRLARYAALLDTLEEKGLIQDPAGWMEMDLPLSSGYYIRPFDLYLEGQDVALLDIAEHRKPAEQVLDSIRPGWRESRSRFEVFEDTDGQRSIRVRSE